MKKPKIAGAQTIRQAMKAARLGQLTPCKVKGDPKRYLHSSRTRR